MKTVYTVTLSYRVAGVPRLTPDAGFLRWTMVLEAADDDEAIAQAAAHVRLLIDTGQQDRLRLVDHEVRVPLEGMDLGRYA